MTRKWKSLIFSILLLCQAFFFITAIEMKEVRLEKCFKTTKIAVKINGKICFIKKFKNTTYGCHCSGVVPHMSSFLSNYFWLVLFLRLLLSLINCLLGFSVYFAPFLQIFLFSALLFFSFLIYVLCFPIWSFQELQNVCFIVLYVKNEFANVLTANIFTSSWNDFW